MGSTSHRANILGTWVRMGVGAYKAADGRKLYAVLFSVPCAAKPKPVSKPAPRRLRRRLRRRPTAEPTAQPTPEPTVTEQPPRPSPARRPARPVRRAAVSTRPIDHPTEASTSLRVRERAPSQGPLDSLFKLLFGGSLG